MCQNISPNAISIETRHSELIFSSFPHKSQVIEITEIPGIWSFLPFDVQYAAILTDPDVSSTLCLQLKQRHNYR